MPRYVCPSLVIVIGLLPEACTPSATPTPLEPSPVVSVPAVRDSPAAIVEPSAAPPVPDFAPGALSVRQDGRIVRLVNHEVTIARRPFELAIPLVSEPPQMMVHVSFTPEWYNQVRSGVPVERLEVFFPGRQMAESSSEPSADLMPCEDGVHYFYWSSDTENRCHQKQVVGGTTFCIRRVEQISPVGQQPIPMAQVTQPKLYLSFLATTQGPSLYHEKELARDWLCITFE